MVRKNSQIHVVVETKLLEEIKEKARKDGISLAEYCRTKLKETVRFEEIIFLLNSLISKNGI
ncbi:MAG: hypothetical protein V1888_03710 [archaeon]